MTKQPIRRRGPVPQRKKRVYVLTEGTIKLNNQRDVSAPPYEVRSLDLTFYLNRLLDQTMPLVVLSAEVERVVNAQECHLDTLCGRFSNLTPDAMARMIKTVITDQLPRGVTATWLF